MASDQSDEAERGVNGFGSFSLHHKDGAIRDAPSNNSAAGPTPGIFHIERKVSENNTRFLLIADHKLYLKADETASNKFQGRGLGKFQYEKNGRRIKMSFYMAPEDIFDNPEEAKIWAVRSFEAAGQSKKPASTVRKMLGLMDMKASGRALG
ncbi:MAG: TfoX/Sxy family protein [Nitrospirales bacterium]